ncbi:NADH-quinone oxidoreductase subunit M [candidate division KSB1 bacterium]|nr:NADH-quinone oxidoreductase subunit M [candidate division KSB1 bacterium]MBL7093995.1 NADH-quinone oxidoreductase subunit M [candidate division KSB1 bacterium]
MGILSWTLLIPALGAVLMMFLPSRDSYTEKSSASIYGWIAFAVSTLTMIVSIFVLSNFDNSMVAYQFQENIKWIPQFGLNYHIGIDGISILLFMLTTILMPVTVLSSFKYIQKRKKEYYIWLLFLEFTMLGAFVALNLFIFYIFWELMLIPMFFLIGIWGGTRRIYATVKFVLFTVVGSLMMLAGIIYLAILARNTFGEFTFEFEQLLKLDIPVQTQLWLFAAFALAFAIKVPMFPFHTWLPDAHVEAPTAGSVILAGVLLKMGCYGFVRLGIPLFGEAALIAAPLMQTLAVIGIVYGACLALAQSDLKKLVAYSSISHLGYVILGLFALTPEAIQGSILQMVNHGISTGALFLLVGMLYERRHTREIADFGGLAHQLPVYATVFMIITLSSVALPGTNGFVGEFLILLGSFKAAWAHFVMHQEVFRLILMVFATSGVILGAYYMLWMVQRVFFGPLTNEKNKNLKDLSLREGLVLIPFIIFVFWIGLYPKPYLSKMEVSVNHYVEQYQPEALKEQLIEAPQHTETIEHKTEDVHTEH